MLHHGEEQTRAPVHFVGARGRGVLRFRDCIVVANTSDRSDRSLALRYLNILERITPNLFALSRGTAVNRAYRTHKNLYIYLFSQYVVLLLWPPVIAHVAGWDP